MPEAANSNRDGLPMNPGMAIVIAANNSLSDPQFRDRVRQMHAEQVPLTQMVDALGLDKECIPQVRQILEDLDPEVVAGIRAATLAMLDSGEYIMPLDCNVTTAELEHGMQVDVAVEEEDQKDTIVVRPLAPG